MPLHPILQEIVNQTKAANLPPQSEESLQKTRGAYARLRLLAGDPPVMAKIVNRLISSSQGSIAIRLYYPIEKEIFPVLVYFHPGGFVKGDIDCHDTICRDIANLAECVVVSVNYRLAPEYKFPSPIEDGYTALKYLKEHADDLQIDKNRIAIGGENSGGNIAAVLTHFVKEKGDLHFVLQVLIYPQTDYTFQSPSHKEFAKGFLLEEESLHWYADQYIPKGVDRKTPYLSPLWATDFTFLPPALIITAEYDPLRDEAEAYADKLKQAGIKVILHRYKEVTHGFFQMGGILNIAAQAMEEVAESLKLAFRSKRAPYKGAA